MGNGMNKILPGLFLGNYKDARDTEQLKQNNITHILSIHDSARPMLEDVLHCHLRNSYSQVLPEENEISNPEDFITYSTILSRIAASDEAQGIKYLCIPAADSPSQNLARHFKESIAFIHECRLQGEGCLVHCLAGVSRSATLVVAYIMTITDFGWEDALSIVRVSRSYASPNTGFQQQLEDFEKNEVAQFRDWLKAKYGENPLQDKKDAEALLQKHRLQAGDPYKYDWKAVE